MLKSRCLSVRFFKEFLNAASKFQKTLFTFSVYCLLLIQDLFVPEPRGSTEELEPVLNGYYNAILGKIPLKKGRGGAKQIVKNRVTKNSSQESAKGGAAFLAVCRGKVLIVDIYMHTTINEFPHMHKLPFEILSAACVYQLSLAHALSLLIFLSGI